MNGISLIVPLYNKEKTILNCLHKTFNQTVDSFEVIVVDDGSSDNSISSLENYRDRITFVSQDNQGPSAARNNGAKQAKFDHLSFVDADDEITPNFVESHLSVRCDEPDIELSVNSFKVYANMELQRTENLFDRYEKAVPNENFFVLNEFSHLYASNIHSSGFCINKDVFFRSAGFDESLRCWEISDALTRFMLASKKTAVINDTLSLVFEENENSLFESEKNNLKYKKIYCDNIINVIDEIPEHSKRRYFKEVEYLCYEYWKIRKFKELVLLYNKTTALPSADRYFSLPRKIKIVAETFRFFSPETRSR